MTEVDILLSNINYLREKLEYLIERNNENLMNKDVFNASEEINQALNKYTKLVIKDVHNDKRG